MIKRYINSRLILLLTIPLLLLPSATQATDHSTSHEVTSLRTRYSQTYDLGSGTYHTEFVSSPEFTENAQGDFVPYVFTEGDDYYQVQHPWSSARFYDYYTEVWNEEFTSVVVHDDRWTVEYLNKQGKWTDSSFWNITRSYEVVDDGIKLVRTGDTVIGQRQDIYYYRDGSPCKLEIRITPSEPQIVRFVWKQSGIVANSEKTKHEKLTDESVVTGYQWNDSNGKPVWIVNWIDELNLVDTINVVAESHAQGRKASITFGDMSVGAGETAILDPDTFYPDANPETTSVDGMLYYRIVAGATWAAIHDNANANAIDDSGTLGYFQTSSDDENSKWRHVVRNIFVLDTSPLPDTAIVTNATFSLHGQYKADSPGWTPTFNIYSANTVSNTVLSAGDYSTLGTTPYCDTSITYADWNVSGYNDFVLNATGIAAISKTGVSKFSARNNYDATNTPPAWVSTAADEIAIKMAEAGVGFKPKLVITYSIPPTVTSSAATNVEETTATLNGEVTDTGGDNPTVTVYWGDNDGGEVAGNWDNNAAPTSPAQPQGAETFYYNATGLSFGTTYYFNAKATNLAGTDWGTTLTFTTKIDAPTDFTLTQVSDYQVNINWTNPTGSANTTIRREVGTYPADRTSGALVYYDSGTSCNDTATGVGLELDKYVYYYRAWSQDGEGEWSDSYAEGTIGGTGMTLMVLAILALGLTATMFHTRNALLGFPSAVMWAILGAFAYTESTTPWGDWQYYLAFASLLGMTTFCALGAYGLREKRDTLGDEGMEKGEGKFVDEEGQEKPAKSWFEDDGIPDGATPSRRTGRTKPKRKGEFDF